MDLKRSPRSSLHGKREPSRDQIAPSPIASWKPPAMWILPCIWGGFSSHLLFLLKNLFLISRWSLSQCSLCPFRPVFSMWLLVKGDPLSLCSHPLSTEYCDEVPLESFVLQDEKTCFLQSFLLGQVLQPFDHLCCPPLDPLQFACVFIELQGPDPDTALHVWPDKSWVEWDDYISVSTGNVPANAVWVLICLCPSLLRCTADPCSACGPPWPPGCLQQSRSPATQILASAGLCGCVVPGAGPCLCGTSCSLCLTTLPHVQVSLEDGSAFWC